MLRRPQSLVSVQLRLRGRGGVAGSGRCAVGTGRPTGRSACGFRATCSFSLSPKNLKGCGLFWLIKLHTAWANTQGSLAFFE